MQTVVVVIHLMIVLAMIGVVLLQRSEGGGLGIGGGGGFMSSRGTANVLTRATAILAGAFFVTSLMLSILAGLAHRPTSIIRSETPSEPSAPGEPAPISQGGGVLDTLRKAGEQQPQAPAAPTGPQVPQSR
ncbi:MAG: preprotein translocase subunit SecG [Xanthobacteraceae bacterium]